jgi:hypothetical protein
MSFTIFSCAFLSGFLLIVARPRSLLASARGHKQFQISFTTFNSTHRVGYGNANAGERCCSALRERDLSNPQVKGTFKPTGKSKVKGTATTLVPAR